jgi:hypothetical protein
MPRLTKGRSPTLHEDDFFAWTKQVAEALRSDSVDRDDMESIAEEIEDMGKRDRRELVSQTRVLLTHLIKWEIQPERRSNSWRSTILKQRIQIRQLIEDSPSLQREAIDRMARIWLEAQILASEETGLSHVIEPEAPDFNAVISDNFWLNHFQDMQPSHFLKNPLRRIWNKLKDL